MEFHVKLQQLRKQKGFTQEELAQMLYVSRAAVSKWESGRGYPGIESLKAMAKVFHVTVDDLLSTQEVLTIAEADNREREKRQHDLVFGLLDAGVGMLLFLPLFNQKAGQMREAVSLLNLTEAALYIRIAMFVVVLGTFLAGILRLALQNCSHPLWQRSKNGISFTCSILGTMFFVLCQHPYAAIYLFIFLIIKAFLLMKKY